MCLPCHGPFHYNDLGEDITAMEPSMEVYDVLFSSFDNLSNCIQADCENKATFGPSQSEFLYCDIHNERNEANFPYKAVLDPGL
jgi:hypothetical protein